MLTFTWEVLPTLGLCHPPLFICSSLVIPVWRSSSRCSTQLLLQRFLQLWEYSHQITAAHAAQFLKSCYFDTRSDDCSRETIGLTLDQQLCKDRLNQYENIKWQYQVLCSFCPDRWRCLNSKESIWLLCDGTVHFSCRMVQYLNREKKKVLKIILLGVIVVVIKKLLTKWYWSTAPRAKRADLGLPLCLALPQLTSPRLSSPEFNNILFYTV